MAEFNRFDICEAYWCLEVDYNVGGILIERPSNQRRNESIGCQLHRLQFRPSMACGFDSLEENAREIYLTKVLEWKLPMDAEMVALMESFFVPEYLQQTRPDVWAATGSN